MTSGEGTNPADFLPKKPHSYEDLRKAVRSNLDATVNLISPLPSYDVTLETLEQIEPGTYVLAKRPNVSLLKDLPKFKGGTTEVGIFSINKKWLVIVGDDLETELPETLTSVQHDGLFQADIHSHPGDDPGSEQPSKEDIWKLDSTVDGKNYIISQGGVIEFQRPTSLPGGFTNLYDSERAWKYWITEELKVTEHQYNKQGGWELRRRFYESFFGLRTIPWNQEQEIETLLASKEDLVPLNDSFAL